MGTLARNTWQAANAAIDGALNRMFGGRSLQEALINGVMSSMIGMAIRWLGEATGLIPTHVDAPHYRGTLNGDVHVPGTQRVRPNMDVDTRLSLDAETRINLDPEARVLSPDADRWVTVRSPDGTPHTYRPISEHEIELSDGRRLSRQGGGGEQPLGDLTPTEISQIQEVVDSAQRPLEVVGSAARGSRREGSDIDYLVPPSSRAYFSGLEERLPLLDPEHGIVPGIHNPFMGPAVRFEPFSGPVFVPGSQGGK